MRKRIQVLIAACAVAISAPPATAALAGPPAGRQQLVDALDAAWLRILDTGRYPGNRQRL